MKFKLIIDSEKDEEIILTLHSANYFVAKIENLVMSYSGGDELLGYLEDEIVNLNFEKIECITVIDRKTYAVNFDGRKYRIKETLSGLEARLPSYFIRINKSSIANERCIKGFKTAFSGAVDAIFKCGYRDYVSRRCFAEIKRRYNI